MTSSQYCPSCATKIVPASGIHTSPILLVNDFPDRASVLKSIPFATNSFFISSGKILRTEMAQVGIDYNRCRVTNLWLHEPNDNENCFQVGYEQVLEEAKGRKAILLIGSLTVETFTEYKVSDVSGLQVDSAILSCPIIYAIVSPSMCLTNGRGVGEIRNGLKKFSARLEKENLL
jgi:hypothetical protein